MTGLAIPILKFVGTISLGLLTGTSTTPLLLPSPLTLPSAPLALTTATQASASLTAHLNILTIVSASTYTLAYILSPHYSGRHPYLLWTSLVISVSAGIDGLQTYFADQKGVGLRALSTRKIPAGEDDFVDIKTSGVLSGVNGEEVERSVKGWRHRLVTRSVIGGIGFAMGVVGIWGDGAGFRR